MINKEIMKGHPNSRIAWQKMKSSGIVLLIFLIAINGCSDRAQRSNPSVTPVTRPPATFAVPKILAENVTHLSPIQKWPLYSALHLAWSPKSDAFAVTGGNHVDHPEDYRNVFAFNLSDPNIVWSEKANMAGNLAYHPIQPVITVPGFEVLNLFDSVTGKKLAEVQNKAFDEQFINCIGRSAIHYYPDGSRIITMDSDAKAGDTRIYIWDAISNRCIGTLVNEKGVAFDFSMTQDGHFLAIGLAFINEIQIWDVESQKQMCHFPGTYPIALTLDGSVVAAQTANDQLKRSVLLWDIKSCQLMSILPQTDRKDISSMDFSPDGRLPVVGEKGKFQVWEIAGKKLVFESTELPNRVSVLAFSPDGRYLLSETERLNVDDNAIITLWGITQ